MKEIIKFQMPLRNFSMAFEMGKGDDYPRFIKPENSVSMELEMVGIGNSVNVLNFDMLDKIFDESAHLDGKLRHKIYSGDTFDSAMKRRVEIIIRVSDDEV